MNETMVADARDRAVALIQSSKAIYLGTHVRPDGDALGSLLGLALALEGQGKRVARLSSDAAPENYQFLPGADRLSSEPPEWPAEVGIVVDCDGLARVGRLESAFARLPHLIDIDHHGTDQSFGEVQLVDSTAAAAAELVYGLLGALGVQMDAGIATCLYAGILTDTGRFCYGNTTAEAMRIASELVAAGAEPYDIARRIYEERSFAATHLLGVALTRLSPNHDSEIVSAVLTRGISRQRARLRLTRRGSSITCGPSADAAWRRCSWRWRRSGCESACGPTAA